MKNRAITGPLRAMLRVFDLCQVLGVLLCSMAVYSVFSAVTFKQSFWYNARRVTGVPVALSLTLSRWVAQ